LDRLQSHSYLIGVVLWLVRVGLGPKAPDIVASALVFLVGFLVVFNIVGRVLDGNALIAAAVVGAKTTLHANCGTILVNCRFHGSNAQYCSM